MEEREPKLMYIRDEGYNPVGCIAYSADKDQGIIRYGYAIKHPQDKCDKKMARFIAKQRLLNKPRFAVAVAPTTINKLLQQVCLNLKSNFSYRDHFIEALDKTVFILKKSANEKSQKT